jgi:hypothetical protein
MRSVVRHLMAVASRNSAAITVGLVVALTSAGTAAAVSVVLGGVNTSSQTTTLKSGNNGAVLQVTNKNSSGGTSAKGIGITVPAGRAPIAVNASAGKATNLNADMLDGMDSGEFVRGNAVTPHGAIAIPASNSMTLDTIGDITLSYQCPANPLASNGALTIVQSTFSGRIDLAVDNGLLDPIVVVLNNSYTVATLFSGEHLTIQFVSRNGIGTVELFSNVSDQFGGPPFCRAQWQGLYSLN